jgi:hypothetical protein
MPDTRRGSFPNTPCSDCGDEEKGQVFIEHWGPLVPAGESGFFGPNCWAARRLLDRNGNPRPLGTPYEHREHLADDDELLTLGRDFLKECGNDYKKLYALLERVNDAKGRFAGPRQMFDEASRLRDLEKEIQSKMKSGQ